MTNQTDMTAILEQLAAGRIDAAEAARRIDALAPAGSPVQFPAESPTEAPAEAAVPGSAPSAGSSESGASEPTNEELAASASSGEVWAESTDRPQRATVTRESFVNPPSGPVDAPAPEAETPRTKPVNTSGVTRISVRAVGRRVRILGEPAVATLSADGPHVLRRNGSVLEVSSDGEMGASIDGFSILRATRSLDDFRNLGLGKELLLKVNPAIIVDVEVTAGSLNTERVAHLGKVRVTAGGAKLLGVEQIEDALIQAGQATIKGSIRTGRSRVRAESGSLSIQLADDSNVTVHSDSQLGKVSWSGGHTGAGDEVVMGNGSARLDVEVVMGHAQVKVGTDHQAEEADA